MLTIEELKKFIKKVTEYMKNQDAKISQISLDLKNLSNAFHTLLVIKENGNYAMIQAATIEFQMTLQQLPQDLQSEMSQKLKDLILSVVKQLDIIAENLESLEEGNMELYNATSMLFLNVERIFNLKALVTPAYPRPGPFPM